MFRAICLTLTFFILVAAVPTFAQASDEPTAIAMWDENVVDVLDMETGDILFTLELDEDIEILGALLNDAQTQVLFWTEEEAYLWELQPERELKLTSDSETDDISLITLIPSDKIAYAMWSDGDTQIMTVTTSQTRLIWDAETGKLLRELPATRRP